MQTLVTGLGKPCRGRSCSSKSVRSLVPLVADLCLLWLLLQAQASSKALECDLLRKKLSAAESGVSALKGDLADRDAEMDALRQAVKDAEVAASEEQEKAAEEVRTLLCKQHEMRYCLPRRLVRWCCSISREQQ